eukprot:TRINITY_DN18810_c0_g3_i2.p1 TRINITY_DN18810_c0_g3~~TRINITY_DN18810_c0_g3_i2.p1  ORF type:complete len:383 (-),score=96.79 TRINITY_DN18810_c0_g3_i2:22-1170(-)
MYRGMRSWGTLAAVVLVAWWGVAHATRLSTTTTNTTNTNTATNNNSNTNNGKFSSRRYVWALVVAGLIVLPATLAIVGRMFYGPDATRIPPGTYPYSSSRTPIHLFGSSAGTPGHLKGVGGLVVAAVEETPHVFVADGKNHRVHVFSLDGSSQWKIEDRGQQEIDPPQEPAGIALTWRGELVVTDVAHHCIRMYRPNGTPLRTFGTQGDALGQLDTPVGVAVDIRDNILVTDHGNHRVQLFRPNGLFLGCVVDANEGEEEDPHKKLPYGISIARDGTIFVSSWHTHTISVYRSDGVLLRRFGGPGTQPGQFQKPGHMTFDARGNLIVADYANQRIQVLTTDGSPLAVVDATENGFHNPLGVALDEEGHLYVSDAEADRVFVL